MVSIGTLLGGLAAYGASQVLRSQAQGVGGLDKPVFVGSVLLLLVPMALASLIPALRAMRTNPAKLLRLD